MGIDGSGKTTQAKRLVSYLDSKGVTSKYFKLSDLESIDGKELEKLYLPYLSQKQTYSLRLVLAALQMKEKIERIIVPAIHYYDCVVMDRYLESIFGNAEGNQANKYIVGKIFENTKIPDLCIYLDVQVECALDRIKKRNVTELVLEKAEKLNYIADYYKNRFREYPYISINGEQPVDEVTKQVRRLCYEKGIIE